MKTRLFVSTACAAIALLACCAPAADAGDRVVVRNARGQVQNIILTSRITGATVLDRTGRVVSRVANVATSPVRCVTGRCSGR